jgi:hypothetical protein
MLENKFRSWNFLRILRLAMGTFLVIEAAKSGMWLLVFVGVVFVAMPLLNIGCCATGNCSIPKQNSEKAVDEVEYEELK